MYKVVDSSGKIYPFSTIREANDFKNNTLKGYGIIYCKEATCLFNK